MFVKNLLNKLNSLVGLTLMSIGCLMFFMLFPLMILYLVLNKKELSSVQITLPHT